MDNLIISETSFTREYNTRIIIDSLKNHLSKKNCFYIIDDFFQQSIPHNERIFWLHALEEEKNISIVGRIVDKMLTENIKRADTIVAIGGGITLDIAAFCASIYKRGCSLTMIPTTLIAMIDAAIGGKTGVNACSYKNQIGSFYPAAEVIIDFTVLQTLPEKEIKNGFAELIKIMIIKDRTFFEQTYDDILMNLHEYIIKAIRYKIEICQYDFTDKGERQALNLGHTIAHLIETISNNQISHGDAVAIGLWVILQYSQQKKLLSKENKDRFLSYLSHFCNVNSLSIEILEEIKNKGVNILQADKKASELVKLILVNDICVEIHEVDSIDEFIESMVDIVIINS